MTDLIQDVNFAEKVRNSFAKQKFMETLGAILAEVGPGSIEIRLPYHPKLTQQHQFLHAGVVAAVLDSACGYAAFTLMPAEGEVLTIEYKINLLAPAKGEELLARAQVLKPGKTIFVCTGEAIMRQGAHQKVVAHMTATMMAITGRNL
jgi:uncharacterized protein (TIGR00369 family)